MTTFCWTTSLSKNLADWEAQNEEESSSLECAKMKARAYYGNNFGMMKKVHLSWLCWTLLLPQVLGNDIHHGWLRAPNNNKNNGDETQERRSLIWRDISSPRRMNRWMGELGDRGLWNSSYNVTLRDLVLPGSHDSAAVDFDGENCLDGDESALLDQLGGDARRKTAQTQESSLWDQMYSHGMRFLDIRFGGRTWNGKKYPLQHIFFVKDQVDTLEKALAVVNDFVTENPTEFIVVSVRTNG